MQCFFRDLSFNLSPHTITYWLPTVCMVKDMPWHLSPSLTGKSDYGIIKTNWRIYTGLWKTVKDVQACLSPHNTLNDNGLQCMMKDWKMNWNEIQLFYIVKCHLSPRERWHFGSQSTTFWGVFDRLLNDILMPFTRQEVMLRTHRLAKSPIMGTHYWQTTSDSQAAFSVLSARLARG